MCVNQIKFFSSLVSYYSWKEVTEILGAHISKRLSDFWICPFTYKTCKYFENYSESQGPVRRESNPWTVVDMTKENKTKFSPK